MTLAVKYIIQYATRNVEWRKQKSTTFVTSLVCETERKKSGSTVNVVFLQVISKTSCKPNIQVSMTKCFTCKQNIVHKSLKYFCVCEMVYYQRDKLKYFCSLDSMMVKFTFLNSFVAL